MTLFSSKHHHSPHPYVFKGLLTSGILLCTTAVCIAPEMTTELTWFNMLVSLFWVWGDELLA